MAESLLYLAFLVLIVFLALVPHHRQTSERKLKIQTHCLLGDHRNGTQAYVPHLTTTKLHGFACDFCQVDKVFGSCCDELRGELGTLLMDYKRRIQHESTMMLMKHVEGDL